MAFPTDPRDVEVSVFIDGAWVDAVAVGNSVLVQDQIRVRRGRSNWAGKPDPARATWSMGNRDGRWSPDNMGGAYAGLFKLNLPARVGVGQGDVYLRHNGTTSADVISTPDAAALDVAGDLDFRIEFQLEKDLVDIDSATGIARVRLAHKVSTGPNAGWELQLYSALGSIVGALSWHDSGGVHTITSEQSGSALPASLMWERSALRVALDVSTGGVSWYTSNGLTGAWTQVGSEDTSAGATNIVASTAALRIGGNPADGNRIPFPGKIFGVELRDGATVVANPNFVAQTVGATSFNDAAGNTWTVGGGGRLTNMRWRFHGELSSIPTRWNVDGSYVWAPVEAQGLFRRLRQGARPLESPLRRAIVRSGVSMVDYWPMEETGTAVTRFGNLIGSNQMIATEALTTASESGFVASKPLPVMNTEIVSASTEQPASTGELQLRWLQGVPATFTSTGVEIVSLVTTDGWSYRVEYRDTSGGQLRVIIYNASEIAQYTSAWSTFGATGTLWRMSLYVQQNGANLNIAILGQEQDAASGGNIFTSVVAHTLAAPSSVTFNDNAGAGIEGWAIGQVTLQNAVTSTSELETELSGYAGEKAGTRIQRLCREEGLATRFIGDPADTEAMGPQPVDTLVGLLEECARTDLGILSESRDSIAVFYRTRATIEAQEIVVDLNYSNGEVLGSPHLDRDDFELANDITVRNSSGTEARSVLDDGSDLSISEPPTGAGRYAVVYNINADLDSKVPLTANAVLALSAVDEPRVSQLSVGFHQTKIVANPTLSLAVLNSELGDRVDVANMLPVALGSGGSVSQVIQGTAETIDVFWHQLDWNTSPFAPWLTPLLESGGGGGAAGISQANLVMWIDAAQDSTAVNLADDQTYSAQLGSTSGADAQDPTVTTADGRSVWSPDGTDDYIEFDYQSSITPTTGVLTVIFVGVYDSTDTTENYSRWFSTETGNTNGLVINSWNPGSNGVSVALGGATTVVGTQNLSGFTDGQSFMVAAVVNAGTLSVYVPGSGLTGNVDTTGVGTITHASVSRLFHPANDTLADREAASDCQALLIYERALTAAQLDEVADFYGLLTAGGSGGAASAFNNGAPGDFAVSDIPSREKWYWEYDTAYFEPQHDPADDGPVRQVWVSASGTGDGLSSGNPTTLDKYMSATGITPTAGDQVRLQGVGPHVITSNTLRSINGTAADPIRFVRDVAGTVPVVQNSSTSSTWGFTNSSYLGFHGIDIDGNWPTYDNIWGLSFGQRFSTDTSAERCHHIDVWHCTIHDMAQNTFTFEGTNGNSTNSDHRGRFVHLFGCDIYNSGQDTARNFCELTYFGSGSESNDHAHDVCIEASHIHDGPSGEAIDIKQENFNTYIVGNKINNIRVTSQGGVAAFLASDLYYHYNAMWDVDEKAVGGADGCGVWCSSIDADTNLMWDFGITAFVSSRLQRGTMGVVVRRLTAWDMRQTTAIGSSDLHFQNTSVLDEGNLPTLDFGSTCISDDGTQGSTNAAVSDFVGPTTGSAEATAGEPGSGFLLASSSSIAATSGALGKQ